MTPRTPLGLLGALWGVVGVVLLLGQAMYRLTPLALEPIVQGSLTMGHAAIYVVWVAFNLYFEGYRAFQRRFSPRVVARAMHLWREPTLLHVALAPVFCMAFFHAKRRARVVAWATALMVVGFVLTLPSVPQPWRGIVDGGVVLALLWGAVAVVVFFIRGLGGAPMPVSAELPGTPDPEAVSPAGAAE